MLILHLIPQCLETIGEVAQRLFSVNDHWCPVKGFFQPCKSFKYLFLPVIFGEIDLNFLSPFQGHASAIMRRICHESEDGVGDRNLEVGESGGAVSGPFGT